MPNSSSSKPRPTRRTPIERFIEDGSIENRRTRWEAAQVADGFVRTTLRVHKDDADRLKAYAAKLLKKRQKLDGVDGNND